MDSLIKVTNAAFGYDGKTVVSKLCFSVNRGDYLCIVGENGSGKSTLIKGLLRLVKPQSGTIEFGEVAPAEMGYLPQQTQTQKDFPASVFEVVLSGRLSKQGFRPFYSKADKKIANENIERLGIKSIKNKCYHELSGGQQQRALLARSLCSADKVLCLDEPAAGLDPLVSKELYSLVDKINSETGIAVIMVSHDIETAVAYASHILHLKNDQMFFGTTSDYINSEIGRKFMRGAV
jgi:ABC-type Mn/Zn transport systems, ATPase component